MARLPISLCLALAISLHAGCPEAYGAPERPNILLVVVDTLAARHTGVNNPALTHTPALRSFADAGTVFERAIAPAPWTKPSLASIFTGLYPSRHGVKRLEARLDRGVETLAERLSSAGYSTHGIISHTLIQAKFGYDQGFGGYELVKFSGNVHDSVTSQEVNKLALQWLDGKPKDKPFFLFLHYFDPHFNYQHHERFSQTKGYAGPLNPGIGFRALRNKLPKLGAADMEYLVGLYREEIAYTDQHLGELFAAMEKRGLKNDTLVVLTADHGEEFREHGSIGHTRTLYEELVNVPFVVSWPNKIKAQRSAVPVSTVDVTPTILEAAGLPAMQGAEGISLLGFARSGVALPERPIFSEVDFVSSQVNAHLLGVVSGPRKAVRDFRSGKSEYLDLSSDPEEKRPAAALPNDLADLLNEFEQKSEKGGAAEVPTSPEEIEQLKSLGYL